MSRTIRSIKGIQAIFWALPPDRLQLLRDTEDASQWALEQRLNSPCAVELAREYRDWWSSHPRDAAALRVNFIKLEGSYDPNDVLRADAAKRLLEDPRWWPRPDRGESAREWRERSDELYRKVFRIWHAAGTGNGGRPVDHETVYKYARWFVMYQVLGFNYAEISASEAQNEPSAPGPDTIAKGVKAIAAATSIRLRRNRN